MFYTFVPATTSNLSTVTFVKALDSVAVSTEQMVMPIIIHTTENRRAFMDFGVLSPYLNFKIYIPFNINDLLVFKRVANQHLSQTFGVGLKESKRKRFALVYFSVLFRFQRIIIKEKALFRRQLENTGTEK